MQRFWIAAGLLLSLVNGLSAAPVNNPSAPALIKDGFFISPTSWLDFRLGYEGNFVNDAKMKQTQESFGRVDDFKIDVNAGSCTLNFWNRLDLYGIFGAARIRGLWQCSPADALRQVDTETKYRFTWAAGGKVMLFEWGRTALTVGGRYFFTRPKLEWLTWNGSPYAVGTAKYRFREWQADLGLSHQIDLLTPYLGIKYSRKNAHLRQVTSVAIATDGSGSIHMRERQKIGMVAGCGLSSRKFFMLNLEVRLIDEEALTVTGDFRF